MSHSRFYRQSVPAAGLSLERATPRVPDDGSYYVILGDDVKGKFRMKRDAVALYQALLKESGYTPPQQGQSFSRDASVETYLDEMESYWSDSHRFQRRGGKGRY